MVSKGTCKTVMLGMEGAWPLWRVMRTLQKVMFYGPFSLTPPNRGDYGGGCKNSDLMPCVPSQPNVPIILAMQHAIRVVAPKCRRASMALSVERFESRLEKNEWCTCSGQLVLFCYQIWLQAGIDIIVSVLEAHCN